MTKLPPLRELVNVYEVGAAARQVLPPALFDELGAEDRRAFDRITFRPRMMRDVTKLDLGVEIFGEKHFTPILIGPVADVRRFHPAGEAELRQGAAAARATAVSTEGGAWVSLAPGARPPAEAKVLVVRGWSGAELEKLRRATAAAIVCKGVLNAADARRVLELGLDGLVVSNYGAAEGGAAIEALPAVVDAVAGRAPVFVDGGFRRGTDIAKALAFGARAVWLTRPALWGLAAYGAEGVQYVVELLQAELARAVAMLGQANLAQLDRTAIRVHRW